MRKDSAGNPLPPRMHEKHGRYYHVFRNHWRPLTREYYSSLRQLSMLESPTDEWAILVAQVYDRYERRHKLGELAKSTIEQYRGVRPRIEYGFSDFVPDMVETSDITSFLDLYEETPNIANRMLTVIKAIFERAVRQGKARANPAHSVKRFDESQRDRYLTDAEFMAIRDKANPHTLLIIDMCYLTAQRISDVLKIKNADITSEFIYIEQEKSKGKQIGSRLHISMDAELQRVVSEARALHKVEFISPYLFHPKGKATKYSYTAIRDNFVRARTLAKVENTTIHDIRAKAITDAENEGLNPQALAGHKSASMTERYIRLRKTVTVSGPNIRHIIDNRR